MQKTVQSIKQGEQILFSILFNVLISMLFVMFLLRFDGLVNFCVTYLLKQIFISFHLP